MDWAGVLASVQDTQGNEERVRERDRGRAMDKADGEKRERVRERGRGREREGRQRGRVNRERGRGSLQWHMAWPDLCWQGPGPSGATGKLPPSQDVLPRAAHVQYSSHFMTPWGLNADAGSGRGFGVTGHRETPHYW